MLVVGVQILLGRCVGAAGFDLQLQTYASCFVSCNAVRAIICHELLALLGAVALPTHCDHATRSRNMLFSAAYGPTSSSGRQIQQNIAILLWVHYSLCAT